MHNVDYHIQRGEGVQGKKMILHLKNPDCIYIVTPKCANSAIKHRLFKLYYRQNVHKDHLHSSRHGVGINFKTCLEVRRYMPVFSFVRNPWARVTSLYNNKIRVRGGGTDTIIRLHKEHFKVGMPFDDFVHALKNIDVNSIETETHIRSMSTHLYYNNVLLPNFVGRLENIETDWPMICEQIGINSDPLPLRNDSKKLHDSYKDYYTNRELVNIVGNVYSCDVENFKYDFSM